jgi:hypothetical protein
MMRSSQTTAPIATALHSCPALCTHIGLQGLVCLSTCSKSLHDDVTAILCGDPLLFLDVSLDTARSSKQQHHYQAVAWIAALLLRTAPANAADVTERLLNFPEMPLVCAHQLVPAGMRITYAQLLAAADSMVAGAEVWVQAQQELGVITDIQPAALSICCGGDLVSAASGSGQVNVTCCKL